MYLCTSNMQKCKAYATYLTCIQRRCSMQKTAESYCIMIYFFFFFWLRLSPLLGRISSTDQNIILDHHLGFVAIITPFNQPTYTKL